MSTIYIEEPKLKGIIKIAPLKNSYDGDVLSVTSNDLLFPLMDIVDICGTNPSELEVSKNSQSSENSGRSSNLTMKKELLGRVMSFDLTFSMLSKEQYQPLHDFFVDLQENSRMNNLYIKYIPTKDGSNDSVTVSATTGINIFCKVFNKSTGWSGIISEYVDSTSNITLKEQNSHNFNGASYSSSLNPINVTKSGNDYTISVSSGWKYSMIEVDGGELPTDPKTTNYSVWYYMEVLLPQSDIPIKEIVYVGDSGFTSVGTFYKGDVLEETSGQTTTLYKVVNNIYGRNVKIPLIAKRASEELRYEYV